MDDSYKIIDENISGPGELELSRMSQNFLDETRKWAKFLAIMLYIFAGISLFFGFIAIFKGNNFLSPPNYPVNFYSGVVGATIFFLASALQYFPAYFLNQFAKKMKIGLQYQKSEYIDTSFQNLKRHFKFIGILTIVVFSFYALAIIIYVIALTLT